MSKETLISRIGSCLKFPINGNFEPINGLDLLLQDIQLLLLTNPGERVMNPQYGCGLRTKIWENIDKVATDGANEIQAALRKFEPRITVTAVNSQINRNTDLVLFQIKFIVNATNTQANLVFPFRASNELAFG